MPISIKKLAANTSTAKLMADEEVVAEIVYHPALINEEIFAQLEDFGDKNSGKKTAQQFKEINETLVYLVESWDIYEDEEKGILFPLDADALKRMPPILRIAIIGAIMEDYRPESLMGQNLTQSSGNSGATLRRVG